MNHYIFQELKVFSREGPVSDKLDIARELFDLFAGFLPAKTEFFFELLWRFFDREIRFKFLFCNVEVGVVLYTKMTRCLKQVCVEQ